MAELPTDARKMAEAPAPAAAAESSQKKIDLDECKRHTTEKDCWIVLSGKVYDVTEFLDEHPGGFDIVVAATGKDATEDFEEIGHSNAAREMLDKFYIGEFEGGPAAAHELNKKATATAQQHHASKSGLAQVILPLLPILILLLALYLGSTYLRKAD